YLGRRSIEELDAFSGIGPVTITRLRESGYESLADLYGVRLHAHGLGRKRLDDVRTAARKLIAEARSRFAAGGCAEAQELALRLREKLPGVDEHGPDLFRTALDAPPT